MTNPFVHVELMATDVGKAKSFYGKLFDWEMEDTTMFYGFPHQPDEPPGGVKVAFFYKWGETCSPDAVDRQARVEEQALAEFDRRRLCRHRVAGIERVCRRPRTVARDALHLVGAEVQQRQRRDRRGRRARGERGDQRDRHPSPRHHY